jgi:hypothetical protein
MAEAHDWVFCNSFEGLGLPAPLQKVKASVPNYAEFAVLSDRLGRHSAVGRQNPS